MTSRYKARELMTMFAKGQCHLCYLPADELILLAYSLEETEKAVQHARSARRKRWICFFLVLIILAIVCIVVGVTVGKNN